MAPYLFVIGLVVFWIHFEKITLNRKAFWIPLFLLSIFAGIRSSKVGTDTGAYVALFEMNLDPKYYQFNPNVEIGYQYFEYTLLNLTHNYYWLFLLTAFFIVYSFLLIIKKYSINYSLSVFIYITLGIYTFFFNGLRQGIAIAICFLALPYLINKIFLKYLFFVFFASFFHISAWIMLPFYFLVHANFKLEYKVLISFFSSLFGSGLLISHLAQDNIRYEAYAEVSDSAGGYIMLLFYLFLAIVIYFLGKKDRLTNNEYNIFEQIYLCGSFLVIPITFLGTSASGPQRIINYFIPILVFLIPFIISKLKYNFVKFIFYFGLVIFFYITTMRFSNLTPYLVNPVFEIF